MIGAGGAARALAAGAAGRHARLHARAATWPPDATGCDLIVNATPVRDELLVEPRAGPDRRRPRLRPTSETALVAAARAAGCEVIDGREALVRQGAASFELWTGLAAPVEVMRDAVRAVVGSRA